MLAAIFALAACGKKETDSKDIADTINRATHDSLNVKRDLEFVTTAAELGMLEVSLGQLAMKKAKTNEVRAYGQSMVADHGAANEELQRLAQIKVIVLPDTISEDQQEKYAELAEKAGLDFDKAYIDLMIDDHEKTIREFEREADKGREQEIRNWAAGKVPTLKHHLEMAKKAKETLETAR